MTKPVPRARAPMPGAAPPAPGAPAVAPKPWQKSLTIQGGALAAAAGVVLAYGPAVLGVCHVDPVAAGEVAKAFAGVMSSVAGLMTIIGRLRLGGLH